MANPRLVSPARAAQTSFDPLDPAASGYKLVFGDEFWASDTIDFQDTGNPGFNWYFWKFFGHKASSTESISVHDGILIINPREGQGVSLVTATPANNPQGWVGQAFGGGAYFEANISFDPKSVNPKDGWPAFWSMAIEHLAGKGADQWPGQPAEYAHFVENDFFEYDTAPWAGADTFGGAIHDWYGKWKETCPAFCDISNSGGSSGINNFVVPVPAGTDWKQFHTIGQLWVVGNSSNGNQGYVQYYFDGKPTTDRVAWENSADPGVPPPSGKSIFSVIDRQHLAVVLGSGSNQPMSVKWIKIWQFPGQGRLITSPIN